MSLLAFTINALTSIAYLVLTAYTERGGNELAIIKPDFRHLKFRFYYSKNFVCIRV